MFINQLSKYPRELIAFTNSIKHKVPIKDFIKLDFRYQLGWYIEYLHANNLSIVVNRISYRIYFSKSHSVKRKKFSDDTEVLDIWREVILVAFNYLENPF